MNKNGDIVINGSVVAFPYPRKPRLKPVIPVP